MFNSYSRSVERLYGLHRDWAGTAYLLAALAAAVGFVEGWWGTEFLRALVLMGVGWIGGYAFLAILVSRFPPRSDSNEIVDSLEEIVDHIKEQQTQILERLERVQKQKSPE